MRTQQYIAALVILIVLSVATYNATRPDLGLLKFTARGDVAIGNGYTDGRSVGMVRGFLRDNPQVRTLVFGKALGTKDADRNFIIGREIRRRGLNTHLTRRSVIASGAVDLFLAGVERTMDCGALIGVHSWSSGDYYYPARIGSDPRQKLHERFLSDMGVDPDFYAFTRDAALPDDMYYLSGEDIARFGLLTEDGCRA